jgi:aminopeptidase C
VGSYPGLQPGYYRVKRSSIGIPDKDALEREWLFLNLSNQRLQEMVVASIDEGVAVDFSANMSRGLEIYRGIMHPDIRLTEGLFGLQENEKGKELSAKDESLLGQINMEHAMVFVGYDKRDGKDLPARKFLVRNSWGYDVGGSMEVEKNYGVIPGDFHMYREWFEKNVWEIMVPKTILTKEEAKMLEGKPRLIKSEDAVLLRGLKNR